MTTLIHIALKGNLVGTNKIHRRIRCTNFVANELLMNYCFGHADSQLMFFPYSPMVNYIYHDRENPNTMIRWTDEINTFVEMHPIDVLEQHGGTLRMEYVALREIAQGEEITIDYGPAWSKAWKEYESETDMSFRHEIGVPEGFYAEKWLHTSVKYELAPKGDVKPGELQRVVWKHNGKPFTEFAH